MEKKSSSKKGIHKGFKKKERLKNNLLRSKFNFFIENSKKLNLKRLYGTIGLDNKKPLKKAKVIKRLIKRKLKSLHDKQYRSKRRLIKISRKMYRSLRLKKRLNLKTKSKSLKKTFAIILSLNKRLIRKRFILSKKKYISLINNVNNNSFNYERAIYTKVLNYRKVNLIRRLRRIHARRIYRRTEKRKLKKSNKPVVGLSSRFKTKLETFLKAYTKLNIRFKQRKIGFGTRSTNKFNNFLKKRYFKRQVEKQKLKQKTNLVNKKPLLYYRTSLKAKRRITKRKRRNKGKKN